jgi:hypothetical protein
MTRFLETHFRYYTMNSWNRSQSYACNLKVYRLGLDSEIENKLYDMLDTQEFFDIQKELMDGFGEVHHYQWQVGMNGRSGGYLVLYQGELKPSGYKSYCTCCGQKNYRAIAEAGRICSVCRRPSRMDYAHTHMRVTVYPGRGTDEGADFGDWSMEELRDRVKLVRELDMLANRMVAEAVRLARDCMAPEKQKRTA